MPPARDPMSHAHTAIAWALPSTTTTQAESSQAEVSTESVW